MPMATAESPIRNGHSVGLHAGYQAEADSSLPASNRKEDPVSASIVTNEHGSKGGSSLLRMVRTTVFGAIGTLYVASLFSSPLREILAKIFSYFPR